MVDVFHKLGESIITNDFYILVAFFIEVGFLIFAAAAAHHIMIRIENRKGKKCSNSWLIVSYNLFTTGISIFPLLGMFGTVSALLGLDLTAGDMSNIKNNFFNALTSTAWGIIFSVFFKLVNAFVENYFDTKIAESTAMAEEYNKLLGKRK